VKELNIVDLKACAGGAAGTCCRSPLGEPLDQPQVGDERWTIKLPAQGWAMSSELMHKVVIHKAGGYEKLR
jgi:hypothetical protein